MKASLFRFDALFKAQISTCFKSLRENGRNILTESQMCQESSPGSRQAISPTYSVERESLKATEKLHGKRMREKQEEREKDEERERGRERERANQLSNVGIEFHCSVT